MPAQSSTPAAVSDDPRNAGTIDGKTPLKGMLSRHVQSVGNRVMAMGSEKRTLKQWVTSRLMRQRSFRQSISIALLIATAPVFTACCISWLAPSLGTGNGKAMEVANNAAQLLGSVYAILLAVIVFSVQLHTEREFESAVLARYVLRKHVIYWIVPLVVGVTVCNFLVLAIEALGASVWVAFIALFDLVFVPGALLSSLWLMHATVRDATGPTFERVRELFLEDIKLSVGADQYVSSMVGTFRRAVASTERLTIATPFSRLHANGSCIELPLAADGFVIDVDLDVLREIDELVQGLPSGVMAQLIMGPGDRVNHTACLYLADGDTSSPKGSEDRADVNPHTATPAWADAARDIRRLLPRLYQTGCSPFEAADQLNDFLGRFKEHLLLLAAKGPTVQLKAALEDLTEFTRFWSALGSNTEPGVTGRLFSDRNRFAGPLAVDLHDVTRSCIASDEDDRVEAILAFLGGLAYIGFRSGHAGLLGSACQLQSVAYFLSAGTRSADEVGRLLDNELHSLLQHFHSRSAHLRGEKLTLDTVLKEQPLLDQVLILCLSACRTAMESGRCDDATHFVDRVLEYRRYRWESVAADEMGDDVNPESVHCYALMAVCGWAVHLIEGGSSGSKEAACAVIGYLRKTELLPNPIELIRTWEAFRSDELRRAGISERLRLDWHLGDRTGRRAGVITMVRGGDQWLVSGLHLMLLWGRRRRGDEPHLSELSHEHLWDSVAATKALQRLAQEEWAGIPEAQRDDAIAAVVSLIESREMCAKRAAALSVAKGDIDLAWKQRITQSFGERLSQKRDYLRMLTVGGAGGEEPTHACPMPVLFTESVPRGLATIVADEPEWWAPQWAEHAEFREAIALLGLLETLTQVTERLTSIWELQRAVRSAVTTLRKQGLEPNLVFLPQGDRFTRALFGCRSWQIPRSADVCQPVIGTWEGLAVVPWPHDDASRVVIVDAARAFGKAPSADGYEISVADASSEEREGFVRRVRDAKSPADIPDKHSLRAQCRIKLVSAWGIREPAAGLAVDLLASDAAYAIQRDDHTYHRIGCEGYTKQGAVYALSVRLHDKPLRPCALCHPETLEYDMATAVEPSGTVKVS